MIRIIHVSPIELPPALGAVLEAELHHVVHLPGARDLQDDLGRGRDLGVWVAVDLGLVQNCKSQDVAL